MVFRKLMKFARLEEKSRQEEIPPSLPIMHRGLCEDDSMVYLGLVEVSGATRELKTKALVEAVRMGATDIYNLSTRENSHPGVHIFTGEAYRQKTPEEYDTD